MKKRIRILFADDHSVVRSGLRTLFRGDEEFSIVGEATNGEEATDLAAKHNPDVVILDISMPKVNGVDATRIIKQHNPETKVLILTIHEDEEFVDQLIRAGADGYVLKNAEKKEIFTAVRSVVAGERFFSPTISNLLIEGFVKRAKGETKPENVVDNLSRRETEILGLIAQGLTSREIADKLFLSMSTINTHRTNIMKKLDIHDTASLVRYAIQTGLVS